MLLKFLFFLSIIEYLNTLNLQNLKKNRILEFESKKTNNKNENLLHGRSKNDFCRCSGPLSKSRVVNGTRVIGYNYEWVVAIYSRNRSRPTCTGSLISESTVLTNAHCDSTEELNVLAGFVHDWKFMVDSEWGSRKISKFIKHPLYEKNKNQKSTPYDIAIIELDRPFELGFNNSIYLACILENELKMPEKLDFWFAAYGHTKPLLHLPDSDIYSITDISKGLNHIKFNYDAEICDKKGVTAVYHCLFNDFGSACYADSGGPVHVFIKDKLAVVSILQYSNYKDYFGIIQASCFEGSRSFSLKVSRHLNFIKKAGKPRCLLSN